MYPYDVSQALSTPRLTSVNTKHKSSLLARDTNNRSGVGINNDVESPSDSPDVFPVSDSPDVSNSYDESSRSTVFSVSKNLHSFL